MEFDTCEKCLNEELRNTDFTQSFEAQKPEELVKCEGCNIDLESFEVQIRETYKSGNLGLCDECASEFDFNSRCAVNDGIEDDNNHDCYGFYPEDRPYQSDDYIMADYGDRE